MLPVFVIPVHVTPEQEIFPVVDILDVHVIVPENRELPRTSNLYDDNKEVPI